MGKLTVKEIESLRTPKRYLDGDGLYLELDQHHNRRWMFRYQLNGKRTTFGLGSYDPKGNSLAMARTAAAECRALVHRGIHPKDHVNQLKAERKASALEKTQKLMAFQACAQEWYERNESGWTNLKHRQQTKNTLRDYVYPFIGHIAVADVGLLDVKRCLDPIWETKTETASRVRQRLEAIFSYAIVNEYRTALNPAQWKGYLDQIYVNPETIKRTRHFANGSDGHMRALSFELAPQLMKALNQEQTNSARALEFTLLTVMRTNNIRQLTWEQLDLERSIWTIPARLMKTKKEFRVALCSQAIRLLKATPQLGEFVFPGDKPKKPMSENTLLACLKRLGYLKDTTTHGLRSTFRDWVGEATDFDPQLAEYALAHVLPSATEKAYARGDQLEKRFKLMEAWGDYLERVI